MTPDLSQDCAELKKLAFNKPAKIEPLLTSIHRLSGASDNRGKIALENIRRWLLIPYTLWPVDLIGVGKYLTDVLDRGEKVPSEIEFLLAQIDFPPSEKAQQAVAKYEHMVRKGSYEHLVKSHPKFKGKQSELLQDKNFKSHWRQLKQLFDLSLYRNEKSIIRRSMVQERNFRTNWEFEPENPSRRFQAVFDAFCHRWNLYGMEGEKPLLLKLSVNLTAHGTMIVIPAFWSLDRARDLDWPAIMKLHKARGIKRQGPVLSPGQAERLRQAQKAQRLWRKYKTLGYKSRKRYELIKDALHYVQATDDSTIRRLLKTPLEQTRI